MYNTPPRNPFLSQGAVRAALRSLNVHPSRRMGQHFLTDEQALQRIVSEAALQPTDVVVEVGPGVGVLTWELLQRARHVIAVELDKRLAERLTDVFADAIRSSSLHIVQDNILQQPPSALLRHVMPTDATGTMLPHYHVVANLPYSITSPLLRHFLEHTPQPTTMVVLVQLEVARRIVAPPGKYSMLTHAIAMYADATLCARVPADCFVPVPAVDSAIVRLSLRQTPAASDTEREGVFQLMKAGFLHPRKKVGNSLPSGLAALGITIAHDALVAALYDVALSPNQRAETILLTEWIALYRTLVAHQKLLPHHN